MNEIELEKMTCAQAADRIERAANADRLVQNSWHLNAAGTEPDDGELVAGQQACLVGSIHFRIQSSRHVKHLAPIWFFDLAVVLFDCLPESRMKECALHFASVLRTLDGRGADWWSERKPGLEVHALQSALRECGVSRDAALPKEIARLIVEFETGSVRKFDTLPTFTSPGPILTAPDKALDLCCQALARITDPSVGRGEFSSLWYASLFKHVALRSLIYRSESVLYPCWARLADRTRVAFSRFSLVDGKPIPDPLADALDEFVVAQWKDVWNQFLETPAAPEEKSLESEPDSPRSPDEVVVAG